MRAGHALANLIQGETVWSFYVHPFTFMGFVRPVVDTRLEVPALGYIISILVSVVMFFLLWKRRSVSNLPFVYALSVGRDHLRASDVNSGW